MVGFVLGWQDQRTSIQLSHRLAKQTKGKQVMSQYTVTWEHGTKVFPTCEEAMIFADHLESHGDWCDVVSTVY